jgi:hypothetical protein
MDDSRLNHLVGSIVCAAFAGVVSFFLWVYVLVAVGLNVGLIPIAIPGPQPREFGRAMASIYGSGIFAAGFLAWLMFRLLDRKYSRRNPLVRLAR